jgi:hypothetical protein
MNLFETTFERTLTELDWKQNLPFKVQVPHGVTHLTVQMEYAPFKVGGDPNMLTLTVFSPSGWRGTGHRQCERHAVVLGEDGATAGFLAGPIEAGEWTVEVDTFMLLPGAACRLKLTVSGDDAPVGGPVFAPVAGKTAPRGPGWYRGDLHGHSLHSDAIWDIPALVAFAREQRLDFITLSDHNTVAGLPEMASLAADDLLTVCGSELTTFRGHALALGIQHWVDWRARPGERSMGQIASEVIGEGGLLIIAHPADDEDPYCSGCEWRHADMRPGPARAVEVWNMDWLSECNNEPALALVYGWLNQGCRLALTAGADNHGDLLDLKYGYNVVYAEELSEAAILRAIGAGHLYLSSGPALEVHAQAGAQRAMMGDAQAAQAGEIIQVSAAWSGCSAEDRLALVVDGAERESLPVGARERQTWEIAGGEAHWALVTLRDTQGTMLALTNPIYFDGRV